MNLWVINEGASGERRMDSNDTIPLWYKVYLGVNKAQALRLHPHTEAGRCYFFNISYLRREHQY